MIDLSDKFQSIAEYALQKSTVPGDVPAELARHTRTHEPMSRMLAGEMVGSFLGFLIRAIGARRVLEIGTFTGHSALVMAENLPPTGEVHTVDIAPKEVASRFWEKSTHGHKIVFHVGAALEVIPRLSGLFDFVFIDADKVNYESYFDLALERLTKRGVIVVDNVLWSGTVLKSDEELAVTAEEDPSAQAIKAFNDKIAGRKDLYRTLLPVRDGLFLICRKE